MSGEARTVAVLDHWLAAATCTPQREDEMRALGRFIKEAATDFERCRRLVDLVLLLAYRCSRVLPGEVLAGDIERVVPPMRLALRLILAYGNDDHDFAVDLVLGYAKAVPGDVAVALGRVFVATTEIYCQLDRALSGLE